uniref:Actin-modulator n=1 Tax=Arion vulgaris TaxID=1028688 RepID=A0A0B6ZP87_9EUPU
MPRGLIKLKTANWMDTNLALFGSSTEKEVKKSSAKTEPAWKSTGNPGLFVWRIEKFEVKDWPKESYGEFYNGDSYIVLHSYKDKDSDQILHDVHFWIGSNSSQDEYGTAAYKTVELDTYLDDVPIQHRECEGHESDLFKSYFPKGITTLEGGCATGFRNVAPEQYEPRLFHFNRDKAGRVTVREIPRAASLIDEGDVYILDLGPKLYQYNGSKSNPMERTKAMQYIVNIKGQRGDASSEVLEGDSTPKNHEFYQKLNKQVDDPSFDDDGIPDKKLLRVNTDTAQSNVVKEGHFSRADLKSDDVFICDSGEVIFVWIGNKASPSEKKNGLPYAHNYLRGSGSPWRSITVVGEDQKCSQFETALAA